MDRPRPEEYQPRLTWWGHTWRLLLMLLINATVLFAVAAEAEAEQRQALSKPQWALDATLGVLGLVLVHWRRRWPRTVVVLLTLGTMVSATIAGPATLAAVSVATRRKVPEVVALGVLVIGCATVFGIYTDYTADPMWLDLVFNVIFTVAVLLWGMYIGSRRELVWTLRQRAEKAEAEQELRVAHARDGERARIAREMHDVLAHRISQISLHAGALSYREDLTADEMRSSAAVIRQKAHEALTDLRGVLGVLRDDRTGQPLDGPQPTYADVAKLVADAQQGGARIDYTDLVSVAPEQVPDVVGRTVFRIVQEGITNARKHAPGSVLTIRISGSPDDGLEVLLRNPLGFGVTETPGAGLGLVGLVERAQLRGGRLEHRRDGSSFVLHGWIPWAA
ncbi:sensor histidine kinase [Nocardioides ferulae]|uniref:sensor histidine kinase n=1 Tax=Nocardioides ferulae TaxID=2340821 RepID=UPI000EB35DA4|nr:histidine kinase [Nocardioides ferulae]